jgi:hypothetical protein
LFCCFVLDEVGEWEKFDGIVKRHGRGIFREGENRYEGQWKEDKMCGKGKFTYANKTSYEVRRKQSKAQAEFSHQHSKGGLG